MSNWALVLLVAVSFPALGAVEVHPIDLGLVTPGQSVTFEARLVNSTESEFVFDSQQSADWHTFSVVGMPVRLGPSSEVAVRVSGEVRASTGRRSFPLVLSSSKQDFSIRLSPVAVVYSALDPQDPEIDLGVVSDGEFSEMRMDFSSRELEAVEIVGVSGGEDHLSIVLGDRGDSFVVKNSAGLPWGVYSGRLEVALDSSLQPLVYVPYSFEVRGGVTVSRFNVDFGAFRLGEHPTQSVFINSIDDSRLRVGRPIVDGDAVTVKKDRCPNRLSSCVELVLDISGDAVPGRTSGRVGLPLQGTSRVLWLNYSAVIFSPGARIIDVNEQLSAQSPSANPIQHVISELSSSSTLIQSPLPDGEGPLLRWRARHERSIHSYRVYRSSTETGRQTLVSKEPIVPLSSSGESRPVEYIWRDISAEPGREYWYQVWYVDISGRRVELTDRISVSFVR